MNRSEPGTLDTTTGATTLDEIHTVLEAFWLAHPDVPEGIRLRVGIATAEIGANIVEHAGRGESIRLRMETRAHPDTIEIVFTDDGWEAEVDLTAVHLPDDMAERSRGLALARSVLGELSYRRDGTTNCWILISERFG